MSTADKSIDPILPSNLPASDDSPLSGALTALVDHSATHTDVSQGIHAPVHTHIPWIRALVPGIEDLAVTRHLGNFVCIRETDKTIFESMPIYARIGMHLVFYGYGRAKILGTRNVEHLLTEESIRQGRIYDSPESAHSIPSFVRTYGLQTDELLEPDLKAYKCFNDFFTRKLKPGARPVANPDDPLGVCSAADCRLTVYQTADLAKQFWIKGKQFTIPSLLALAPDSKEAQAFDNGALAIFRLAPADYHRFHAPVDCTVASDPVDVPGQYYTVNPQAVNEPGFDVFKANRRSIVYLTHETTGLPVAVVAIGALLVGSIRWSGGAEKGKRLKRGEELGYFAYGGSTVVVVFPQRGVEFDADLVRNSLQPMETLVKVGNSIGKIAHGLS
ncbi:phosphatidylserine decarboxylase-domain-containing protein [Lyophyllum atratum]|nr:phosphatidylserine decarboxylase-domain-containing protein [Lyophyllum atratum]